MTNADVFILGKSYTVKGEATREQILQFASFVDDKIKEVTASYPGIAPDNAMLLALMNMAEEIHHLRAEHDILTRHIKEKTDLLSELFD